MKIIDASAYLLKDILAVISMLLIMNRLLKKELQLKNIKVVVCAVLFAAVAFSGIFIFDGRIDEPYTLMDALSNILYIIILLFAVKGAKFFKTVFMVMFYIVTIDMFFSLVAPYLPQKLYIECAVNSALFLIVSIAIEFASRKTAVNILPKVFSEIPKWLFVALFIFDLTCYYKEFGVSSDWYNILYLISCVAVILCVFYLVFKVILLTYEQSMVLKQLSMQADYVQSTLNSDDELRRFRHDYKNHMIVVNSLLESGKNRDAKEYLDSISAKFNSISNGIKSGNFTADAIINSKILLCEKKDIEIRLTGKIPPKCIKNEDVCTLLANLLDNAIEACEAVSGKKIITVESVLKKDILILSVNNPTKNNINLTGKRPKTTKVNKKYHGFGIQNIERIAEKYSGNVSLNCENNIFTADVMIRLQYDAEKILSK